MCLPILAAVGTAMGASAATAATVGTMATISAVGTGISAYSAYQQGQTAKDVANYNAQVADYQAKDTIARGGIAEDQQRQKTRQIMGAQRAQMGASGAVADSGSFGDILTNSAQFGEMDALTIRNNAMRQAWGSSTQAANDRFQGEAAARAGTMNAVGTVLGGAGDIYMSKSRWWKP